MMDDMIGNDEVLWQFAPFIPCESCPTNVISVHTPCPAHHHSPPFSVGSWAPASYFCKASSCIEAQKVRGGSGCPHGASWRLLIRLVVGRLQRRRGLGSCQQDRATPRRETGGKKRSWTFQTASFILGLAVAWLSGPNSLVWEESCQGQRNPILPLSWQRA